MTDWLEPVRYWRRVYQRRRRRGATDLETSRWILRRLSGELWAYARAGIHRANGSSQGCILFAQPRTGGSLLLNLLGQHPGIDKDGELLHWRVLSPRRLIDARRALSGRPVYLFKLCLRHLQKAQRLPEPERFLREYRDRGWRFIALHRRNSLRRVLSAQRATRRQRQWNRTRGDPPPPRTKEQVDLANLLHRLERDAVVVAERRRILESIPHLSLTYEDDLLREEAHQRTADRVFQYLGLPPRPVRADLVRLSSDDLRDQIENFEEFQEVIGASEYAAFLEEG